MLGIRPRYIDDRGRSFGLAWRTSPSAWLPSADRALDGAPHVGEPEWLGEKRARGGFGLPNGVGMAAHQHSRDATGKDLIGQRHAIAIGQAHLDDRQADWRDGQQVYGLGGATRAPHGGMDFLERFLKELGNVRVGLDDENRRIVGGIDAHAGEALFAQGCLLG
jgi:hypothetical protein